MGVERAAELYERAIFGGDSGALAEADRELDAVEAALALTRAKVLHARALESPTRQADPRELELAGRAATLYRERGDRGGEAEALFWVGCYWQVLHRDNERAGPALTESYRLAQEVGDRLTMSYAARHLGFADRAAGKLADARARQEESLRLRRELDFRPGVAAALLAVAETAYAQGESAHALTLVTEAAEVAAQAGAFGALRWIALVRNEIDPRTQHDPGYEELAHLYDVMNRWGPGDDFYLGYVRGAGSVLDVGCGTGGLLARARADGHRGDLAGADPATGMLAVARAKRDDIDWIQADVRTLAAGRRFELITMTGHAFQELLDDTDVRAAFATFRRHLLPGGRIAFETRNPAPRNWERWTPEHTTDTVTAPDGEQYRVWNEVVGQVPPDLVEFTGVARALRTGAEISGTGPLRFIDPERLRALLAESGFAVEEWYGNWDRSPVTPASPEVIVIARAP